LYDFAVILSDRKAKVSPNHPLHDSIKLSAPASVPSFQLAVYQVDRVLDQYFGDVKAGDPSSGRSLDSINKELESRLAERKSVLRDSPPAKQSTSGIKSASERERRQENAAQGGVGTSR
jgi:hypothetical protein